MLVRQFLGLGKTGHAHIRDGSLRFKGFWLKLFPEYFFSFSS